MTPDREQNDFLMWCNCYRYRVLDRFIPKANNDNLKIRAAQTAPKG